MPHFYLVFILCFSFAACVTKSSQNIEKNATELQNYTGGLYLEIESQYTYDNDGNEIRRNKSTNTQMEIDYNYRTVIVDTALGVKAQEFLSLNILEGKAAEEIYVAALLAVELTEQGRLQLMNLSMSHPNRKIYLVLAQKIIADFDMHSILAEPIFNMHINSPEDLIEVKALFAQKQ